MKRSKKIVALVLSAFSLAQSAFQPCCAMVNEGDNNSATQSNSTQSPPEAQNPANKPQIPNAISFCQDMLEPVKEHIEQLTISILLHYIISNSSADKIYEIDDHDRTYRAIDLRQVPADKISEITDHARLMLRLYSAPCYGQTFIPSLTKLANALATTERSDRTLKDEIKIGFQDQNRAKLKEDVTSTTNRVIDYLHAPNISLKSFIGCVVYARLILDSLVESGVAEDLGVNLDELTKEVTAREAKINEYMLATSGCQ